MATAIDFSKYELNGKYYGGYTDGTRSYLRFLVNNVLRMELQCSMLLK